MNGSIDAYGRALLMVDVRPTETRESTAIEAWVDTGFNGDLVLPLSQIDDLDFPRSGSVDAVLADGSPIELNTYTCFVDWFGSNRRLEVVANEGEYPLLGVGLLLGLELRVNYRALLLTLNEG
jgi:clan AA aspartic protease